MLESVFVGALIATKLLLIIMLLLIGDDDYNSGPYNVTFLAGVTRVPFNVSITDDNVLEDNESFSLSIDFTVLPNNVTVANISQTTVNILDNDGKSVQRD